jgi:hypothetical protein
LLSCKKDDNLVKFEGTYKGLWQMNGGNFPDSFVKISKIDKKGNLLFMESPGGTSAP